MNVSNQIRNLISLNLTSFIRTVTTCGVKIRSSTISPLLVKGTDYNKNDFVKSEKETGSFYMNVNTSMTNKTPIMFMKYSLARTQISDPKIKGEINIGIPFNSLLIEDFKLPNKRENNVVEPVGNIVEKKAINIRQIRKKKMRKHKWKKLRRKNRVYFVTKKEKRRARKDKELLAFVTKALDDGKNFNVESGVDEIIEKLKWKAPVTRIRGRVAPLWVIKEYGEKDRLKELLNQRMKECSEKL